MNDQSRSRVCESRLFGSERGQEHNCDMDKVLWHRPESRRPIERTNIVLKSWKSPAYSKTTLERRKSASDRLQEKVSVGPRRQGQRVWARRRGGKRQH